jgi:hypothetical protein
MTIETIEIFWRPFGFFFTDLLKHCADRIEKETKAGAYYKLPFNYPSIKISCQSNYERKTIKLLKVITNSCKIVSFAHQAVVKCLFGIYNRIIY